MPRASLTTNPGGGPGIESFVLESGLHVPFSLLSALRDDGQVADLRADDTGQLRVVQTRETGVWDYAAGTNGSMSVALGGRVLSIAALAGTSAASVSINNGDAIPIPAYASWAMEPKGNLVAPMITFTGTTSYTVEWVTGSDAALQPAAPSPITNVTYDEDGNITSMTEGAVTTTYTYDPNDGRPLTETRNGVTRTYAYDANGKLVGATVA